MNYDHKDIEKKWQEKWENDGLHKVSDNVPGKENFYTLVEFTYPSGNLHVGHWYAFAVPDIFARYKKMQGFNVLYPMGFDAFGLPAENAAIKLGADPKVWTYEQMDRMRGQFRTMGAIFPWDREVVSCDPAYYKWTQWMFNQFLKNDLVYRAATMVNWCPKDQTILANEQVIDGKCDRCGSEVEQKKQEQWMLRITKYADRLIDDLDKLDWPNAIKESQKNWIGRSEGSEIEFQIKDSQEKIKVFTTRADTLFGVTYVVLAPEHNLIQDLKEKIENWEEVTAYIETTKKKSELDRQQSKEKTGIELKGVKAVNPANGEVVPVWIADYVLAGYGTGAVMAVPAHDERDFEFAKKYDLPIKKVIYLNIKDKDLQRPFFNSFKLGNVPLELKYECWPGEGVLMNSGKFDDLSSEEARKKITEAVGGKLVSTYRLRDWGISRQRYWGTPIPIVYDRDGKAHPVPDEHLPWILPTDVDHTPDGTAPLARSKELLERTEKIFGAGWRPEVETMDTFVDSSWYFYRYLDNKNDDVFAAAEKMKAWMPVDLYMGGAEHTTMHLLYSRFWVKALHDLGFVTDDESYKIRRNRGLILGPDGNKMSKSKGNVINPDEIVDRLGADTVRLYLCFMGPYGITVNYPWDPNGVVGVRRFLERVWRLGQQLASSDSRLATQNAEEIELPVANCQSPEAKLLHKTIKGITEDVEEFKFNTSISKMMILMNEWESSFAKASQDKNSETVSIADFKIFLQLLAPFAPHIADELWFQLGEKESIHLSGWPTYDPTLLVDDELKIAIQVNGRLRGDFAVPADTTEDDIKTMAQNHEKVIPWIDGKDIKKIIYVKGKLVSIVI